MLTKLVSNLTCLAMALAVSPFSYAQATIKIAVAGPMTGDYAIWGDQTYRGVEMAMQDLNAKGGVLGRKFEFVKFDDKADSIEAANVAQRIVGDKDLVAVIGHVFSSCTLAAGPIYSRGKITEIAVASSSKKVLPSGNYVFRINLGDEKAGVDMANYTVQKVKAKKIAVIMDQSDYCEGLVSAFQAEAESKGGSIVTKQRFVGGQDRDFNVILTSVKALNPDLILLAAFSPDAALIAQQARNLGVKTPLEVPDAACNADFLKLAGVSAEGVLGFNYFDTTSSDPRIQNLAKRYKANYNEELETFTPYAYDAMLAIADAIKVAGKADRASIYAALPKVNIKNGLTGQISFQNREREVSYSAVHKVKNGQWESLGLTQ
jgi:branched-chain amino acid transport system substrate-binding protein